MEPGGEGGRLGRAIDVQQALGARLAEGLADPARIDGLPAEEQVAQPAEDLAARPRTIWLNRAVVRNMAVTRSRRSWRPSSAGLSAMSLSMMTKAAPLSSAPQISKVAASKEAFEACATRSPGPRST